MPSFILRQHSNIIYLLSKLRLPCVLRMAVLLLQLTRTYRGVWRENGGEEGHKGACETNKQSVESAFVGV